MRKLLLILSFISLFGLSPTFTSCVNSQIKVELIIGNQSANSTVASTVVDDGWYNGFPFPKYYNGNIYSLYKKAVDHASLGPLTLAKSTDASGASWTEWQVEVDAVAIEAAALSYEILASGRQLIAYQDDEVYQVIKFAYSDDNGVSFTSAGSIDLGTGYTSSPSPVKMEVMPSGKVRFGYYKFGTGVNPAIIGFINSTDNGVSWTTGETIFSHNTQAPASPFNDWKGHEFGFTITHNTGSDATCKMIALVRVNLPDEGGTYYLHFRSADGGATWSSDYTTEDAGSFTNDNGQLVSGPFSRGLLYSFLPSNSPVDIKVHNGLVYVLNGERNAANGYKLKYITATPDGAYENKFDNWLRPVTLLTFNATTLGSSIDCGYPIMFEDQVGHLWCQYYDISTQAVEPGKGDERAYIRQVKVLN
jgi:hypothetical protein